MLFCEDGLGLRLMEDREEDYRLMHRWCNSRHILETYSGEERSLSQIREKYRKRILGEEAVTPAFIVLDGRDIGYLQFYRIDPASYGTGTEIDMEQDSYAMDLFIGEEEELGKGIGSRIVGLTCSYLFRELCAQAVYIDPRTDNVRGIRSYLSAGFREAGIVRGREMFRGSLHDSLIMKKERMI